MIACAAAVLLVCLTEAAPCRGFQVTVHPVHKTLTEVEYVADRGVLEVAFWLWPPDLEAELSARAGKRVDLDREQKDKKLDGLLTTWISEVFVVKRTDGKACPHKWVGKELAIDACWVYFEVDVGKRDSAVELENKALLRIAESPIHTTTFVRGKKRSIRNLTRDAGRWKLVLREESDEEKPDREAKPDRKEKPKGGAG
ncbi:MAG: hypothetical protein H6832_12635 [Planctomycetes bacterium]|nr:hypothetical protein [Planctomycetota bacterium]MCB9919240.1 hypothetical protein [Planctomycetota bacterium]